jgi:RES domain-containing protein
MIEFPMHLDPDDEPSDLVVVRADIPQTVSRERLSIKRLPAHWRESPAPNDLAGIGDRFAGEVRVAILIVPSVLAPAESNWLINPLHPDFARIKVCRPEPFRYDPRFFQNWSRRN